MGSKVPTPDGIQKQARDDQGIRVGPISREMDYNTTHCVQEEEIIGIPSATLGFHRIPLDCSCSVDGNVQAVAILQEATQEFVPSKFPEIQADAIVD